jgi:hypothetical protein
MLQTEVNDDHTAFTPAAGQISLQATARPVFLGWEKLRFVYIVVMAGWCRFLFMTFDPGGDEDRFWMRCIFGGIIANLCYFAGPIFETYVTWLSGRRRAWLRPALFVLGALFTMLLALATLVDFAA